MQRGHCCGARRVGEIKLKLREPQEVERSDEALYFRFSDLPIAHTKSYAEGELNVDIDDSNDVVGVEVLSFGPEETKALAEVQEEYSLSLNLLKRTAK